MSQILDDLRNVFRRKDDTLTQLLVVNIGVFVAYGLFQVVLFLMHMGPERDGPITEFVRDQLWLPASLPRLLTHPWTLITYFFTQFELLHLLFNMLFLFWFGQLIQEYVGSARLLSLYILGGIAGGLFYILCYNVFPVFQSYVDDSTLVGSSAAVYAVVVGAATLLPDHRFSLLLIGSVRIVYIAAAYVLWSLISIAISNSGGNLAHLGGALMGYLFISQLRQGRDLGAPITAVINFTKGLFNRRSKMHISYSRPRTYEPVEPSGASRGSKSAPVPKSAAAIRQEEVDAILDKMLVSGYNSLTLEEKRKLDAAGEGGHS